MSDADQAARRADADAQLDGTLLAMSRDYMRGLLTAPDVRQEAILAVMRWMGEANAPPA